MRIPLDTGYILHQVPKASTLEGLASNLGLPRRFLCTKGLGSRLRGVPLYGDITIMYMYIQYHGRVH